MVAHIKASSLEILESHGRAPNTARYGGSADAFIQNFDYDALVSALLQNREEKRCPVKEEELRYIIFDGG